MKKPSYLTIGIISFFVLIIIGIVIFNILTSDSLKIREFAAESDKLVNVLSVNTSVDAKIMALTRFINFSEKQFQLDRESKDEVPQEVYHDVVVAYVKLGNLYEEQKNHKSEKCFDTAIKLKAKFVPWIKGFKIETKDDLRRYVADLEQKTKK